MAITFAVLFCSLPSQSESLRNLIVSEAADWQVLTLRLAVQLQGLKNSAPDDDSLDGSSSKYKQVYLDMCNCTPAVTAPTRV